MAILAKNDKIGTSSQPKWDPLVVVLIAIAIAFVYVLVPGLRRGAQVHESNVSEFYDMSVVLETFEFRWLFFECAIYI